MPSPPVVSSELTRCAIIENEGNPSQLMHNAFNPENATVEKSRLDDIKDLKPKSWLSERALRAERADGGKQIN
jgi:hypothetical protein